MRLSSAYGIWLNGAFAHKRNVYNIQKDPSRQGVNFKPKSANLLKISTVLKKQNQNRLGVFRGHNISYELII